MTKIKTMENILKNIDLGNNESVSVGVARNENGTFTALTFTKSKTFKTIKGAKRWLDRNYPKWR